MSEQSLAGRWQFRCPHPLKGGAPRGLHLESWMPATMPGTIHFALQKLGKIPDPYFGRNELDVQWVDEQSWELARFVKASRSDCESTRQELVFDGLDTVATIYLNGKQVGRSENMFRQVVCDVRRVLRPGRNELSIRFDSPTAYAQNQAKRSRRLREPSTFVWQTGEERLQAREWIRKAQCHFGWDWGVYLATSGIWQPARLSCSNAPRVSAVKTVQTHRGRDPEHPSAVMLDIAVFLVATVAQTGAVRVRCGDSEQVVRARLRPGENRVAARVEMEHPRLWWPAQEGEQHLYPMTVEWLGDDRATGRAQRRIGLRTIELVTRDEPNRRSSSQSFFFRVNGRPIYARGADFIPVDQLVDRATPNVYRHLLRSMVEANMNMVRVWGGGVYEQDAFYDACDDLGLLVWQDFMMACALYPDTREFLAELTAEAAHQIRRLHDRPCIALWCGDNECAEAVLGWWKDDPAQTKMAKSYERTIAALADVCQAEDTTRRFWPSSPWSGSFRHAPTDPSRGDIHHWKVWHGRRPFNDYLAVFPRFVSEFGFQSFPEARTLRAVVPKGQLNPSSRVMEHHQRSPEGNVLITNTMAREMPIPKDFDSFCIVSQINQALAIKTAVHHWRRQKPRCMGALYWQLNDLWPVASWSSIDYYGRWKVLHHEAARFFAPLLATIVVDDGTIRLWITSDLAQPSMLAGKFSVVTWSGKKIFEQQLRANLVAEDSREVVSFATERLLGGNFEPHDVCCFVEWSDGARTARAHATLVPWKWAALAQPKVASALRLRDGRLELVVHSATVVPFFHAELEGSEAHFQGDWDVLPPGTRVMTFVPHVERGAGTPNLREARRLLRSSSLYDWSER